MLCIQKITEYKDDLCYVQILLFKRGKRFLATHDVLQAPGHICFGNPRSENRPTFASRGEAIAYGRKRAKETIRGDKLFNHPGLRHYAQPREKQLQG
jgi:hypothetical protein